ncbi:MAG: putative polysaccharide biosynthesis protein [Clostridia bacterium]|jgi:stage V sporulation protein B
MEKKSFIRGAAVLGFAGFLGKIIGAFYRIPLTNIIGPAGMGLYQIAYPIYAFLLVVSTTGIPTAISKMVSARLAVGNRKGAHEVFRTSFKVLACIGTITTSVMLLGSRFFADLAGNRDAGLAIMAIAPSLFFVSLLSAYRGYFQGMQMMEPTAVSQLVEQLGKLILGFGLAYRWKEMGPAYGAAGALIGVTLSEIAALVLLLGVYHRKKRDLSLDRMQRKTSDKEGFASIGSELARIGIPVTLGASIIPLVSFLDTGIVINRLKDIGFHQNEATSLFGLLTAVVNPLVNMPAVFTVALAMSLVPAVSQSHAIGDEKTVRTKASAGLRLSFLLGFPSAAGLWVLAQPIIGMLYRSLNQQEIAMAAGLLRTMAVAVLFLSIVQTLTGILQGMDRIRVPIRNLLIGAALKVVINYILIGIPSINIQGAPVGTVLCYGVAAFLNIVSVLRETGMKFPFKEAVMKPGCATAMMIAAVWMVRRWAEGMVGGSTPVTLLAILTGVLVYFILLLLMGSLREEDIMAFPGGKRIRRLMIRMGVWKATKE